MNAYEHDPTTLLIRRVVFVGNDDDPRKLRDRVVQLATRMVQGLAEIPHKRWTFIPRSKLADLLPDMVRGCDFILIAPEGNWNMVDDKVFTRLIRYRADKKDKKITLAWSPMDGGSFSHNFDQEPERAEDGTGEVAGYQTEGEVRPHRIRNPGPQLPLRVIYAPDRKYPVA